MSGWESVFILLVAVTGLSRQSHDFDEKKQLDHKSAINFSLIDRLGMLGEHSKSVVHFLKRILQVVDNAVFSQNVLLYFENDPLSPSFKTFSIVVTRHTKYGRGSKNLKET